MRPCSIGAISAMVATIITPHRNMNIRPTMKLRLRKISPGMNGRSVVIETWDGLTVHLPNSELLDTPLVNVSTRGVRRSQLEVRTGVGAVGRDEVMSTIAAAANSAPGVLDDPQASTLLTAVDFGRITVLVQFWHKSVDSGPVRSAVVSAISDALQSVDEQATVIGPPPAAPLTPQATR